MTFTDAKPLGSGRWSATTQEGGVYISTDNGQTWNPTLTNNLMALWCHAYRGSYGIAVGDGIYFETNDAGNTWSGMRQFPAHNDNGILRNPRMKGVCFSGNNVVVVGTFARILIRPLGGTTWDERSFVSAANLITPYFNKVADNGQGTLVASGYGGLTMRSGDFGVSWNTVRPFSTLFPDGLEIFGVQWASPTVVYMGGLQGTLLKSTDAGHNWTQQSVAMDNPQWYKAFRGIFVHDEHTITGVGDYGTVLKSTDDGLTWTSKDDRFANIWYCVAGDGMEIDVFGDFSAIMDSPDGELYRVVFGNPPLRPASSTATGTTDGGTLTTTKTAPKKKR